MDKTLNSIVWDESGDVYFSSFNTSTLPYWSKLHNSSAGKELVSALYSGGTLYAGDLDTSSGTSTLYKVNTSSYALTEVDAMAYFAVDLAPAYSSGKYVQPYVPYVMVESLSSPSGNISGHKDLSSYIGDDIYIAGIAAQSLGRTSYYYVLDENGIIWRLSLSSTYSFGTPSKVVETGISTSFLYQNLYYDGTYIYWSHQDGGAAEMIIINPSTKAVYHAGNFGENVWPVGGMYVNGKTAPASEEEILDEEVPVITEDYIDTESVNRRLTEEISKMSNVQNTGSLNSVKNADVTERQSKPVTEMIAPVRQTAVKTEEPSGTVSVSISENDETVYNGFYKVVYDPSVMNYVESISNADYSSVYADESDGLVYLAFADGNGIASGSEIERITFTKPSETTQVTITTVENNTETPADEVETVTFGNDAIIIEDYKMSHSHSCSFDNNLSINYYAPKEGLEGYGNIWLEVRKEVHEKDGSISWKTYELRNHTDAKVSGVEYYTYLHPLSLSLKHPRHLKAEI